MLPGSLLARRLAVIVLAAFAAASPPAGAQAPFLSYDFADGSLGDFFNPSGPQAIDLCGQVIPSGEVTVDAGEALFTNDATLGLATMGLLPEVVEQAFPADSRNYALRLRANLESVNELSIYVRSRIGLDEGALQINSRLERGYVFGIFPQGIDATLVDGVLALGEYTGCHTLVPHGEWPGAGTGGYARIDPGFAIVPGEWYWLEVTSQGDDDGGPVVLTGKLWIDGDDPPARPQITATDPDGLAHTAETLDPAAEVQVSFGTSFDIGQQPGATCRLDDISLTRLTGCDAPPVKAVRALWNPKLLAEGSPAAAFEVDASYAVSIALSDVRAAGLCDAAASVKLTEAVPAGATVSGISNGGTAVEDVITWSLSLPGAAASPLTYSLKLASGGKASFQGELSEPGSTLTFVVEGESVAVSSDVLPPVSDFGSIQHWLILGPFTRQVGGANPGDEQIVRDYLTDGAVTEADVQPRAGDTIDPDYDGAAASTGLAPNLLGRNPGDLPAWIEWRDFDDADDRIDFESVYGDLGDVMCYAVTYLDVEATLDVSFGVSSDDAVHILLDGVELHRNNAARGALARVYQDTPLTHPGLANVTLTKGQHTLLVKVFEGGGEHDFRVGFLDESGIEIPGGPEGVTVSLVPDGGPPAPIFRRGDADANGILEITDAILVLSYLFTGGATPACLDATDADDNGQVEITDPIRALGYLFLGGPAPAAPGPDVCGTDPEADELAECAYSPPAGGECG